LEGGSCCAVTKEAGMASQEEEREEQKRKEGTPENQRGSYNYFLMGICGGVGTAAPSQSGAGAGAQK